MEAPRSQKCVRFAQVDPHIKTLGAPNPKSHRKRWALSWPCLKLIASTSITPADSMSLTTYVLHAPLFTAS